MYYCICITNVSCTCCEKCHCLSALLLCIACVVFFSDGFVLSSLQSWGFWLLQQMDWNGNTNAWSIHIWMTVQMDLFGNWWLLLSLVSCQAVSVGKFGALSCLCSLPLLPLCVRSPVMFLCFRVSVFMPRSTAVCTLQFVPNAKVWIICECCGSECETFQHLNTILKCNERSMSATLLPLVSVFTLQQQLACKMALAVLRKKIPSPATVLRSQQSWKCEHWHC